MRCAAVTVAVLLVAPAMAGAEDRLSTPLRDASQLTVAAGPGGRAVAAWTSCMNTETPPGVIPLCAVQAATLQGQRWDGTRTLGPPEIAEPLDGPVAAVGGRGVAAVAWTQANRPGTGQHVRVAVRSSGLWLAPHEVDLPDEAGGRPAVGVDGRGNVLVVWVSAARKGSSYAAADRVRAAVWRPATGWTRTMGLGPAGTGPGKPSIAPSTTGTLRAAWTLRAPRRVAVTTTAADGLPGPVRLVAAPGTQGDVTVGPAGDLLVSWSPCTYDENDHLVGCRGVYTGRAAPGARRIGRVRRVANATTSDDVLVPQASLNAAGVALVWWDAGRAAWVAALRARAFGPVHSPVTATHAVSIVQTGAGSVMEAWTDRTGLHTTVTDITGAKPVTRRVSTLQTPAVMVGAARPAGGVVLGWSTAPDDTSGASVVYAAATLGGIG